MQINPWRLIFFCRKISCKWRKRSIIKSITRQLKIENPVIRAKLKYETNNRQKQSHVYFAENVIKRCFDLKQNFILPLYWIKPLKVEVSHFNKKYKTLYVRLIKWAIDMIRLKYLEMLLLFPNNVPFNLKMTYIRLKFKA